MMFLDIRIIKVIKMEFITFLTYTSLSIGLGDHYVYIALNVGRMTITYILHSSWMTITYTSHLIGFDDHYVYTTLNGVG